MIFHPVDAGERLRDRVDLIIVTHAGESEQFGDQFTDPSGVLPEVHRTAVKLRGLRGESHDLVAVELEFAIPSRISLVTTFRFRVFFLRPFG
jgi:hypothetical protein